MPRYIDADKLNKDVLASWDRDNHRVIGASQVHRQEHNHLMRIIEKQPTADVAEVVRCENCRYFYKGKMANRCTLTTLGLKMPHRDAWCCYGERKES